MLTVASSKFSKFSQIKNFKGALWHRKTHSSDLNNRKILIGEKTFNFFGRKKGPQCRKTQKIEPYSESSVKTEREHFGEIIFFRKFVSQ